MKTKNLAFLGLLGAAGVSSMAFAPSAEAVIMQFVIPTTNFDFTGAPPGTSGNVSGSFRYDTVTGQFSSINIVTSAASSASPLFNFSSRTYDQLSTLGGDQVGASFRTAASNLQRLSMSFGPPLDETPFPSGNIWSFGASESQGSFSRSTNNIQAVGTPVPFESDAFPVVASGVLLGAGFWLKRKRDMAKVQLPVSLPQPPEMVASAAE
ncbi:hypothetical protein [Synechocystis sp. CACIAM 05]|uniref:hypothetical protein n=1 Tax=Synechocystis sp. CACIAM 05 TaxID=1933929 RepID=UPI00138E5B68|nr:hypothetical protein [Synechocystis sp. CACIAM 05]QHU99111.1 hypothetical protein BWK47_02550 [Synechocystis sp. CACIAM 05]